MNPINKLLKLLPFSKNNHTQEFYFALNIEETEVEAAVWGILGKRLEIISTSVASFTSEDELIKSANITLDQALADFTPEPTKVLFGVPDFWLLDDDLKPEYLKLLRRLVKQLDISPMAYVSTTQAISHLLHKQQGVPLTAILVKLSDPLNVAVVKAGKIMGSKAQKRTERLPQDIEKALMSFTDIEVLPSKILTFGKEKEEKTKDELQSFSWMAQLPFLHLPKIESLPEEITIQAICLAGASELHPDISFNPKVTIIPPYHLQPSTMEYRTKALMEDEETHPPRKLAHAEAENFGFVSGDIEQISKKHKKVDDDLDIGSGEEFDQEEDERQLMVQSHPTYHNTPDHSPLDRFKALILSPLTILQNRPAGQPKHHPGGLFAQRKFIILPFIIVLLLIGAFVFLTKAKVTVFIDLKVLEKDSQVVADPNVTTVDEASNTIPGKVVESRQSDSAKGPASGKKKVGDPAKGKVVIYNKTNSAKTLGQGTILAGPNNLKFSLDTSVQIASQSSTIGADFSTIIKPGKSDAVSATASTIGPDGNIAANTELSVGGFSQDQVVARVDSAFAGGVSKDVTVVTSDDQKKLLAKLASDLRKKAQEEIQSKQTAEFKVLEEGLEEEIVKKSYSKNVGDQASEFSLALTANFKGTAYNENDLKTIVSKLVETIVPSNYSLDLSKTETQADVSKLEKGGKIIFLAKFKAKLMPKLDQNQIKKDIVFKTPEQAAERLKKIENVFSSNIAITPSIPIKPLQRLPLLPQNITLEVTAK